MPDGENTPQGQEPGHTQTPGDGDGSGSGRSIDAFPEEAQDYIRRLRQENASHRNELKSVRNSLKEFEDRDKTEAEKRAEREAELEKQATSAAAKALRYEVAAEVGLPLNLAGRLQGSTAEELKADAENLKQQFGLAANGDEPPAGGPGFDGGVRRPVARPKSMNGLIRQAAGR